jgi:GAF domain-containing protein
VSVDPCGNIHRVSDPNRRVFTPRPGSARPVTRRAASRLVTRRPASEPLGAARRPDRGETLPGDLNGPHAVELAGLLHELTVRLLGADSFAQALDRLAAFAAGAVPGAVHCSVALIGEGGPLTIAAHGGAGQSLDRIQYDTSTGPGLLAARTREVVTVGDLAEDPRWPELAAQARVEGVRSVVAVPIDVRRADVGALSIYTPGPDGVGPATLITAMAVVNQAEVLLAELRHRDALAEGATVDRAVGAIIAQRHCGVQEAYAFLQDTAQRLGLDRRTVADRLLTAISRGA